MKLSQTVSYAIHATLQLAQAESSAPIPCSKLASNGQMPERFLLQILRSLVTKGILRSTRGVDGGYALARPAEEISLQDLMEVFEGESATADSVAGNFPEAAQKRLQAVFSGIRTLVHRELDSIKLADLIDRDESAAEQPKPPSPPPEPPAPLA